MILALSTFKQVKRICLAPAAVKRAEQVTFVLFESGPGGMTVSSAPLASSKIAAFDLTQAAGS